MNSKEKLNELYAVKRSIESQEFQTYIMKPLKKELDSLKPAYDCKSLTELATLKGKRQGLSKLAEIIDRINVDIKNIRYELEKDADH